MVPQHMHVSLTNHSMQRWLLVAVTCLAVFSVTVSACGAPRTDSERVEYWVVRLGLDNNASVRAFAAAMLGRIANADTDLSKLIETLRTDPDVHVRANAAVAVGSIGGETLRRSVGALVTALTDPDGDVVSNAAMALAQVDPKVPKEHLAKLIDALRHGPVQVKDHCATAIARFGAEIPPEDLRTLLDLLKDGDTRVLSGCVRKRYFIPMILR